MQGSDARPWGTGKSHDIVAGANSKLTSDRDKSGALIYLNYTGIVGITEGLAKILGGAPDAKTTDFGNSCT